jgi:UDP-N-acetylmuramoyl-L-alanyl-D-glutamate--2,6-diaminopimelate ligase
MTSRSLAELTAGFFDAPSGISITDVTLDSRAVKPGALFLACRGRTHHGLEFVQQAIGRGAGAVLFDADEHAEKDTELSSDVFVAGVHGLGQRVGTIADRFFDMPSRALNVTGITGTNGKTTSAYLLAQALSLCGRPAGYMGTLGFGLPDSLQPSHHTTSDVVSVHRQLDTLRRLGATCVCMEVSSHALDQARVDNVSFHTAVFTNLTRDHLDYHGTMQAYAESKALLFAWPTLQARVINVDDAFGAELAKRAAASRLIVTSRAPQQGEFVTARRIEAESSGLVIGVESSWGNSEISVPLIGEFNAENVLSVLAVLLGMDIPLADAARALAQCRAPSGRMETFGGSAKCPLVVVDYAHTPDALGKALRATRQHCRGRLSVVFGCGGDRDAGKRPLMGAVAAELADQLIVTDDNPRTEDPQHIVADVLNGIANSATPRVEHDRARAIREAIESASPDDAVLVAGKGHEDYQIYGHERRPFSDQAIVREQLKRQACSAR